MRLEIILAQQLSRRDGSGKGSSHPAEVPRIPGADLGTTGVPVATDARRRPATVDAFDVFIDGANVTARVRESHGALVLRDLAQALVDLSRRARAKAVVRFYDEPWELCVERFGATACLSVYRTGPEPIVAVYDRAVPFDDVVVAARDAIARVLSDGQTRSGTRLEFESAAVELGAIPAAGPVEQALVPGLVPIVVEPDRNAPLSFASEFSIREGTSAPHRAPAAGLCGTHLESAPFDAIERSDMHALLFRGSVRAEVRGRVVELGDCHPVLFAECLVDLGRRAFDAWERGLPLHARTESAGVLVGVRLSPEGDLALTLGPSRSGPRRSVYTFPTLGVVDVLEAALAFGRAIVRAILRRDRAQAANLRLSALRRALRETTEVLRAASQSDSKVNPAPEPYRAYAATLTEPISTQQASTQRLRYTPRWRAIVPGIDLRATYLCGDRLIVGAATQMWALQRSSGAVLWRADVPRGTSVVTPTGVARLAPDGTFAVYDFITGERTLRTRIVPRGNAPVAGAVVHLPGLPRLVVVTEGDHHLVAIDLTSGEPRWRWSWGGTRGRPVGAPRMKRAGRLVFFTCGDSALTALDVVSGAVVWRVRDRLRFRAPPSICRDSVFAVSGGAHGVATLYCIDAFSGSVRWRTKLAEPTAPCTIEGPPLVAANTVAVTMRQKTGLSIAAFRRDDGSPIVEGPDGSRRPAAAPLGTSWLAVDDAFIGNTPTGELVAVDAGTADLRWRHVLGPRPLEADLPRRLEPVLRCGALFVPCSLVEGNGTGSSGSAGVCVVRPSDGALLGAIAPSDAIPDLLRVDEQCNAYIAEESGHLAAFGALPRLSIVRPE